jgi:putative spermidine/putrescine transport system ATP-binding protein
VYESPTSLFVAGFVGTSNIITGELARTHYGTDATFAIRPEKVRVLPPNAQPGDDEVAVPGTVREIVYAGAATRVVVEAAGALLAAVLLNVTADPAPPRRGDPVLVTWHRGAARRIA